MATEQTTILSKREHEQALGRNRAKRFYSKNKNKIVAAQQERRVKQRTELGEIRAARQLVRAAPPPIDPATFQYQYVGPTVTEIADPNLPSGFKFTEVSLKKILEEDPWFITSKGLISGSKSAYKTAVTRIFQVCRKENLLSCLGLGNYKDFFIGIENDIWKKTGLPYSDNTTKATFQGILFLMDHYMRFSMEEAHYKEVHAACKLIFDKYNDLSTKQNKTRQETHIVPTFEEYLAKCRAMYDLTSKEVMIALLYSILPVRDDFKAMTIIDKESDDDKINNFLLSNGTTMKFIINNFKTHEKYQCITMTIDHDNVDEEILYNLIRGWMFTKKLKTGDYFVKKSPLSPFVSKMNASLGYDDAKGINFFRHIAVSQLKGDVSFEESKALSDRMGHSLYTQSLYTRKITVVETD